MINYKKTAVCTIVLAIIFIFSISASFAADFNFTTTSDFDAGVRENNSGNYYLETYTDNFKIPQGAFGFSNKYSDRFTFDDADGATWKWNNQLYTPAESTGAISIANGVMKLQLNLAYPDANSYLYIASVLKDVMLTGDFDVQVSFSNLTHTGSTYDQYPGLILVDSPSCWYASCNYGFGMLRANENPQWGGITYTAFDWVGLWNQVTTTDTSGKLRIVRVLDPDINSIANFTFYYWNNTGGDWVEQYHLSTNNFDSPGCINDLYVLLQQDSWVHDGDNGQTVSVEFDDFVINSGKLVYDYNTHRNGQRYWGKVTELGGNDILESITINYSNADSFNYPHRVYITDITGVTVYARADIYNWAGITTGTSVVITEENLDWGSFNNIPEGNYAIILYISKSTSTSTGDKTVYIEEISGIYGSKVPPIVSSIILDDDVGNPDMYIDLFAGTTQNITCTGIISDANGHSDIVSANATIYHSSSTLESGDNRNNHYSNSSCVLSSGYDTTKKNATCTFEVYYYAEPAEWTCTLFGIDTSGMYGSNSVNATVNYLIALNVGGNITFGNIPISEVSEEVNVSISNYGNYQIDIEISGTDMGCDLGSINVNYIRYNTTSYGQDYTESMTSLTGDPVLRTEFDLPKKTTTDDSLQTKNLSLKLKMPFGVKGTCTGSMQFTAYAG